MAYIAGALAMYCWSITALRTAPPRGSRETLSVLLLCTVLAMAWPVVLLWAVSAGGVRQS